MTNKKKIFFLLFSMNVGGVEKSLLGLLSTFDKEKNDIHIGLLQKQGGFLSFLPEWVVIHQCFQDVWDIVNLPPIVTIKTLFKQGRITEAIVHFYCYVVFKISGDRTLFYKYVLRNEPAIEMFFDEAYAYAGPASMLDFYICHKIKAHKRFGWIHFDIRKNGIDKVMTHRFYKEYEKIYVVSEAAKKNFDAEFPQFAHNTEVRYNIVPTEDIKLLAAKAPTFNDDFMGVRILTVGRLSWEKGQDITIEALKILVERGYDVKWYYVGEGKLQLTCEWLAEKYGLADRVVFLGMHTNPYGYMHDCDIYVQPSRHEGYCITLAEVRCFTAPIIATNFVGAEEQLKTHQQNVVTDITANGIAEGIMHFVKFI